MHWYDWHTVTERLQGRAYALTRGKPYRVILDPSTPTGLCDFTDRRIVINPNLFSDVLKKRGLSGEKLDQANFLISRAVTGHEALHVLYSDPKVVIEAAQESPVLKTVLNLLEDARVERIGSETSHVSKTLFRFVIPGCDRVFAGIVDVQLTDGRMIDFKVTSRRWQLSNVADTNQATAYAMLIGYDTDFEFHIGLRANKNPAVQVVRLERRRKDVDEYVRHLHRVIRRMEELERSCEPVPRDGYCNEKMCQYYWECSSWKRGMDG